MRRLIAIFMVWLGCSAAWMLLGATLLVRSGQTTDVLEREVHALWGPPMRQLPPWAMRVPRAGVAEPASPLPLSTSEIDVALDLEHRKKGLLWFPTYEVSFNARYVFDNPGSEVVEVDLQLPLEQQNALYDGFEVLDAAGASVTTSVERGVARWRDTIEPGKRGEYRIKYRSRGTTRWKYDLTSGTGRVQDFRLALRTDFDQVDFLPGTLSPSEKQASRGTWSGVWTFKTLVSSAAIGVELPQRVNPGPLASRITFFAPVSLLFFFFAVAILAAAKRHALHPLHYFFLGTAFFAFHLLFSYLVDHVAVLPSFALASVVSMLLVVSYARLFVGWRFALREIGIAQLLYLVLFSFTFFWTGFTGLAITVGAILTLFVMMQITGRRDLFATPPKRDPAPQCRDPYPCTAPHVQASEVPPNS